MTRFAIMIVVLGLVCGVSQVHGGVYSIPLTNGDLESDANGFFTGAAYTEYNYSVGIPAGIIPNDGVGLTLDTGDDGGVPGWYLPSSWNGPPLITSGLVGTDWLSSYFPVIGNQSIAMGNGGSAYTLFTLDEPVSDVTVTFSIGTGSLDSASYLNVGVWQLDPTTHAAIGGPWWLWFDSGTTQGAEATPGSMTEYTTDPFNIGSAGLWQVGFAQAGNGYSAILDNVSMVGIVATVVPGDTDGDEDVDADDAATLASFWQQSGLTGGVSEGDFNDDGWANDLDATILATNWTGSSAAAVPEPAGLALILGAISILCFFRRR